MKTIGIIIGALTAILGVAAFCMPFRTFLAIGWVLGMVLLMDGIEMVIAGLMQKKKNIWQVVMGVIFAIAGLVLLFSGLQRALTDVMMAYLVGIAMIGSGIVQVIMGAKKRSAGEEGTTLSIICGFISILVGFLSVGHPFLTMISVGYLIGAALVVRGINMVILMCSIKKEEK